MAVRERTRRLVGVGGEADAVVVRKAVTIRLPVDEVERAYRSSFGPDAKAEFRPAPGDQGTEVHVALVYTPSAGAAGDAIAKLRGRDPGTLLTDELRRFKQLLEIGEVPRSDGGDA